MNASKILIALIAFSAHVSFAQVYKCQTKQGLTYSDRPCQNGPSESVRIQPNTLDTSGARRQQVIMERNQMAYEQQERLKYSQVQASAGSSKSSGLSDKEKQKLIKDATTKRSGESRADFQTRSEATMRYLEAAQTGAIASGDQGRKILSDATTKRRGESRSDFATRSAATMYQIDNKIPEKKQSSSDIPMAPPPPSVITSCDNAGCWDNTGGRYTKGAGTTFFGPGSTCQKIGNQLICN